jgi:hypothetical protein
MFPPSTNHDILCTGQSTKKIEVASTSIITYFGKLQDAKQLLHSIDHAGVQYQRSALLAWNQTTLLD